MQLLDDEFELVLFDLDGTLVDTAPDMVAVLQSIQREHGVEPVPYELGRSFVSHGAIGLLSVGFPEQEIAFGDDLHLEYLDRYSENICTDSVVFDGLGGLLDDLDSAGLPWGVVTNKPEQLTNPLIAALGLPRRLYQVGVKPEDVPSLARQASEDLCMLTNPHCYLAEEIESMYREII